MRGSEALTIMLYAARIDPRLGTPGEEDGKAWAPLLNGLDVRRCLAAVDKHYSVSDVRIMPSHIRALARTTTDGDAGPVELSPVVPGRGRVEEPHAGEVLCPDCALIHRRDESCEEFARNRRRQLPRPLGATVKALSEALEPTPPAHERALQRARAERGNVPWTPPRDEEPPPAEEHAQRPAEERDYASDGRAITLEDLPPAGLAAGPCYACRPNERGERPVFLDYPAGRSAHRTLFGHDPLARARQAAAQ